MRFINPPGVIYLMRHGEKPTSAADHNLSPAGIARADQLSGYVPTLLEGRPLDYIFAAEDSKVSDRPVETATPLASALGLPINQSFANHDYRSLAKTILSTEIYAGKTILIVWHHGRIPALCGALGAKESPGKWPGTAFNLVWKLTYGPDGRASVQQITEPF
jgi:broad specificity phosphatase PhoE